MEMVEIQLLPKFFINSGKQENFIQSAVRKEDEDCDDGDCDGAEEEEVNNI